jgi:hypothetical protein
LGFDDISWTYSIAISIIMVLCDRIHYSTLNRAGVTLSQVTLL